MTRFFRSFATVLALVLVMADSANASPPDRSAPTVLLGRLQGWFASLWTPQPLSSAWEEAGVTMDPNGRDSAPPAPPEGPGTDAGITMDPDG